jgi:hypothetical protein
MTYHERVLAYEAEGLTTSDAQGVVDVELLKEAAPDLLAAHPEDRYSRLLQRLLRAFFHDQPTPGPGA